MRYAFSETLSNPDALISKFAVSGSSVADCAYQNITHCTVLSIDIVAKSGIDFFIRDYIIIKRKQNFNRAVFIDCRVIFGNYLQEKTFVQHT